ncbi:hypothetical protein CBR_g23880 [Chara braunii]|uniref:CCHC-type domain-containing protein n=1 Tax=Chara braunii TaxID=69332 RepID=A0A388L549_CHABU|nr:hypothetical protein CBR_g23880 [Chara braunii]|eukprot:GBG77431.1 hypothetical protein CBR_g23880 [Chara braunii]
MAGYGERRDYGGSSHDYERSGRERSSGDREHGGRHRGYGSDRGYESDRAPSGDRHGDRYYDRGPRRGPPTCYNCREPGHYANQCPHPRRNSNPGRGTVGDYGEPSDQQKGELESKVVEIGKSVAAVCHYVELEQQKKLMKERRKAEKKAVEERAAAEQEEAEQKRKKKEDKARKEAERKEEIRKCLEIKMALRVGELRDEVRDDVRHEMREAIGELCTVVARGKQQVPQMEAVAESRVNSSETEELNLHTRNLSLAEKRMRGPETVLEGSPPMELPLKRTPRRTGRLTRARCKTMKTPTPKKTPPSIRKKKPTVMGLVGRLRFEKKVMNDLKSLDDLVLQNICKDERIPYNGKFESVFDIAAHRTQVAYGAEDDEDEHSSGEEDKEVRVDAEDEATGV